MEFEADNHGMRSGKNFIRLALPLALSLSALPAEPPPVSQQGSSAALKTSAPQPATERVDINHAGIDELLKVPGMTQTWAARIVRFRPYRTKLDLLEKGIVNSQVYDRIKDFVIAHRDKQ